MPREMVPCRIPPRGFLVVHELKEKHGCLFGAVMQIGHHAELGMVYLELVDGERPLWGLSLLSTKTSSAQDVPFSESQGCPRDCSCCGPALLARDDICVIGCAQLWICVAAGAERCLRARLVGHLCTQMPELRSSPHPGAAAAYTDGHLCTVTYTDGHLCAVTYTDAGSAQRRVMFSPVVRHAFPRRALRRGFLPVVCNIFDAQIAGASKMCLTSRQNLAFRSVSQGCVAHP